ncbi:MAG: glutamate--tRNA ligase [Cytophagales bacterium]|jgi:glutamyl-tRNA synthetase|tara:strand:+ start:217 stop:1764 length:1548 start_codon:yes stop_codon:yes gene_type:complete
MSQVRVRFAPSPTGGLHIGGVRTAIFNYLYAKKMGGTFILRIEDTDQARFVAGAEAYIKETLSWCGIDPKEGPDIGGDYGPYRQSERKKIYQKYTQQLIDEGKAYYAFDTPEEIDQMREKLKVAGVLNLNYNSASRKTMKNSLTFSKEEVKEKIQVGIPYVVRFKMPDKREIRFHDLVRGWVLVHSSTLDDKVLLKSDGLATYHLANVIDDHLMKITHVIRGEEWLPSAPLHVMLYEAFNWETDMPVFAHLPLIMKPDGNGKLSKRAADKGGFPIFPLNWTDPTSGETLQGFREMGFSSNALVNFLSLLGWNPGGDQEIFDLKALIANFSIERIGKSGTKFDFDKAKWFNQHYLKNTEIEVLALELIKDLHSHYGLECSLELGKQIVELFIQRVTFPQEFASEAQFIFHEPQSYDQKVIHKKWNEESKMALNAYANKLAVLSEINGDSAQELFQETMASIQMNPGKVLQLLRVSIMGGGSGPDLMKIIEILGPVEISKRIQNAIVQFDQIKIVLP